MAALSVKSHPGDNVGNFVFDTSGFEIIQTHARQQCGRLGKKLYFRKSPHVTMKSCNSNFRNGILKLNKPPTSTKINQ